MDDRDQHNIMSINSMDMESWRNTYGKVYKKLIEEGVMSIMSAHITLPAYYREKDPDFPFEKILPGSLSKELNQDLLRGELGFNGLIITDASIMGGYNAKGSRKELLPMSIESGCDMLMFVKNYEEDIAALMNGLKEDRLSERRLDEAVIRVLGLKAALRLHQRRQKNEEAPTETERAFLGCREHQRWLSEVVDKSITLVKDTQKLLPLSPDRYKRILLIQGQANGQFGEKKNLGFEKQLKEQGFYVEVYDHKEQISSDKFDLVVFAVARECIMVRDNTRIDMIDLMGDIMCAMDRYWDEIPSLVISFGSPYHLYDFPHCKTYINAYSSVEPVKKAVAEILAGKKAFQGKNPVDPFCGLESTRF